MRVERDIADAERYVADTSDKTVATPAAVAMLKADYALWMYRMQAGGEAYLAMAQEALGNSACRTPCSSPRMPIFSVRRTNAAARSFSPCTRMCRKP